jgi:hypothetical protein
MTLAGLLVPAAASGDDESPPMLTVKSTADFEFVADRLAPEWDAAEWTSLNRRPSSTHNYDARVKMLYSSAGVYVLFEGADKTLSAKLTEDFAMLWMEDVFEVFLWPDEQTPIYFEYEISPLGYELPILVPNLDGKFLGWRPWMYEGNRKTRKLASILKGKQESGAAIEGWRAEVFIPYELLEPLQNVPPVPGSRWRANFYRMDYDGGSKSSWDWARVGSSFHESEKFGTLVFAE